jgi:(1->4)-alpha-D-glucan 1-alpha-D-glucosylmutase
MRIPSSTYRLQITPEFTLWHAARTIPYLARLGAGWVYLSPVLQAERGSQHGYDVTDHSRVDDERGGPDALAALAAAAREVGMGVLVDIVPNHVGVATPAQNPWWWDLLSHGRESRYAEAFDIDWDAGDGKLLLPVLGDESPETLDALRVEGGELRYYDHRFPLAPGTADDGAAASVVHDRQSYRLIAWRRESTDLNYRRFFAVSSLAAIRVEEPWVFDESHAEIARWFREGLADGVRVDHPDGLADPGGYIRRLSELTGGAYVLIEKILEGDEPLHPDWPAAGTTGYEALAVVDRVLVDPAGEKALADLDERLGGSSDYAELIHGTKRAVADGILNSEVRRLTRDIEQTGGLATPAATEVIADAVAELLTCFPVYRTYLPYGREHLDHALQLAHRHRPELGRTLDEVAEVLGRTGTAPSIRFQQTSGMVMAKGVEDSAFYRWTRLTSLTEVGADPDRFSVGVAEFHDAQRRRLETTPNSMTTLSTHDTKRSEDVRARISALAEIPLEWARTLDALRELVPLPDGPFENLLWQAIVGAWPLSRERAQAYALKAVREAGVSTTWLDPDEEFESRMRAVVDAVYDNPRVAEIVDGFARGLEPAGWSNALSAKLLQLASTGVPDVYQGSELWDLSLVDPDNRRSVDFGERVALLEAIDAGEQPPVDASGAAKLLVVSRALRLRRDRPDWFTGYRALEASGSAAGHVVAFDRGGAVAVAARLPLGLARAGGWGDTALALPAEHGAAFTDAFTGRSYEAGTVPLAELLGIYPVALLTPAPPAAAPATDTALAPGEPA